MIPDEEPGLALQQPLVGGATNALYRALLASVLDPTIAIDGYGKIVTASDSVERVFGWKPSELEGRNIKVLIPEPHHSAHDGYLENYRRTGATNILGRTREFTVVRKDGSEVPIELSVARADLPGHDGPLFVGSFRDISERKRAELALRDSERRFRAMFDRSFEYIGLLDVEGNVVEANRAALEGAGVTREEVIGKPFWETRWWSVSEESRQRLREAVANAAGGEFVRFETVHRGRGDDVRTIDFSLAPIRDDEGRVVMLVPEGRDITELKRAQETETSMLRALATVGESAAMLAHEIKNPITAINLALRAVADQLGEDHKVVLGDLSGRMQRLEQLMRRTLTFTRPLELNESQLDAAELLHHVVEQVKPDVTAAGAEVVVRADPGLCFRGDGQLLEEVVLNLIRNALEASGRRIHIELSASACAPDEQPRSVVIAVEDDGPGIPDSLRGTLFNPFVTTKHKGTGLGLAFSRKVVEAHGGTIEVGDARLGGARFELKLPESP